VLCLGLVGVYINCHRADADMPNGLRTHFGQPDAVDEEALLLNRK
jgi:hypothetical protein